MILQVKKMNFANPEMIINSKRFLSIYLSKVIGRIFSFHLQKVEKDANHLDLVASILQACF